MGKVIHGLEHSFTDLKRCFSTILIRRHPDTTDRALEMVSAPNIPLYEKPYVISGSYNDVLAFLNNHPEMQFTSGTRILKNPSEIYGKENVDVYSEDQSLDLIQVPKEMKYGPMKMSIHLASDTKEGIFSSLSRLASKLINYVTYEHILEFTKGVLEVAGRTADYALDFSEDTDLKFVNLFHNPDIVVTLSPLLNEQQANVIGFGARESLVAKQMVDLMEVNRKTLLKAASDPYTRTPMKLQDPSRSSFGHTKGDLAKLISVPGSTVLQKGMNHPTLPDGF